MHWVMGGPIRICYVALRSALSGNSRNLIFSLSFSLFPLCVPFVPSKSQRSHSSSLTSHLFPDLPGEIRNYCILRTPIMASHPPGSCCYRGVKHEGKAVGKIEKVGDIETYFSFPEDKSTDTAILILTDAIGHESINAQLIADQVGFANSPDRIVCRRLMISSLLPMATSWRCQISSTATQFH